MNDGYIFLDKTLPLIEEKKKEYRTEKKPKQKDRSYYVPGKNGKSFARRKDREIRQILDNYTDRALYEAFLITGVSQFESFLMDVLTLVIKEYPRKLSTTIPGVSATKDVPLDLLLESSSVEDVVTEVIDRHLSALMYGKPRVYLDYAGKVAGFDTTDKAFDKYVEIKATRDLIIHNSAVANEVYLQKAGKLSRGALGATLPVNKEYYHHCMAVFKRLSGIIKRDTTKAYPVRKTKPIQDNSNGAKASTEALAQPSALPSAPE
ncbi:MAG: hypothetical protein QM703_13175 [Gemmatales bacterium]